jgi:hypothetical protein
VQTWCNRSIVGFRTDRLLVSFHFRIFHTGVQRRPLSLTLAAWPLGTFEISFWQ